MTTDFIAQSCPACTEPTEPGDHFACDDGSAYHVLCYQKACVDADMPNPFPLCDYCEQIIWEQEGPGSLIIKGQVCEGGTWRPACWHTECAPGEESPVIERDRVDTPPPQPQPHGEAAAPIVQDTKDGFPICDQCGKPIQRALTVAANGRYHRSCAGKVAATRRRHLNKCAVCGQSIRDRDQIECEGEAAGTVDYYHRKCYRQACIAAGMPDPLPELEAASSAKRTASLRAGRKQQETADARRCGICQELVARAEFRQHVVEHELAVRERDGV